MAPIPSFFNSWLQFRAETSPELNFGIITSTDIPFPELSFFLIFYLIYLFSL
uniref:Candidate secreted effector n=1 Tax=Meloidogyne incognita TaxID=6306 RepID=A0A914MFV6_MELIC